MRSLEEAYAAMPNRQIPPKTIGSQLLLGARPELADSLEVRGPRSVVLPSSRARHLLEVLAFNSLPAAVSDDHWTHQQLSNPPEMP